jgi:hypothetical protein
MRLSQVQEVESIAVLASVCGDAKGLIRKVALPEGELTEARQAREKAKEKVHSLSSSSAEGIQRLVASETEH